MNRYVLLALVACALALFGCSPRAERDERFESVPAKCYKVSFAAGENVRVCEWFDPTGMTGCSYITTADPYRRYVQCTAAPRQE